MSLHGVERLRADDAPAAVALLNRELGDGLYRVDWLLEDAADPAAGVWVAEPGAQVGVAVARLLGRGDSDYYQRFGPAALDLFRGSVGSFEALAIDPAHRRRGIGSALTTASIDWMRERGCVAAITVSWRSGRNGSSAGLFRHLGMREGPTVDRFYEEESRRNGWSCPVCGNPCACAATLFTLRLSG